MEPFPNEFLSHVGTWLKGDGPDSDVVISTRVRLARNVRAYPFSPRLGEERSEELCEFVREKLRESPATKNLRYVSLKKANDALRDALLERFLISRELASGRQERGVAFDPGEALAVMVNEEDHLRLQCLRSGSNLEGAFEAMLGVDRELESVLEFCYSEDLGYLTSCPTNVGTGLRVSVMLHLPALAMVQRELKKIFNVAARLNLAVRGLHGEGSQASGAFFQVSNQVTLGRTERELLEDIGDVVPQIVEFERNVRTKLVEVRADELRARVEAAKTLLSSGAPLSLEAAVAALSALLLGESCGHYQDSSRADLLRWIVSIYPGHLQGRAARRLAPAEVDRERGSALREAFSSNGGAGGGDSGRGGKGAKP